MFIEISSLITVKLSSLNLYHGYFSVNLSKLQSTYCLSCLLQSYHRHLYPNFYCHYHCRLIINIIIHILVIIILILPHFTIIITILTQLWLSLLSLLSPFLNITFTSLSFTSLPSLSLLISMKLPHFPHFLLSQRRSLFAIIIQHEALQWVSSTAINQRQSLHTHKKKKKSRESLDRYKWWWWVFRCVKSFAYENKESWTREADR